MPSYMDIHEIPGGVSAEEVAKAARQILEGDKAGRRKLYQQLGMPLDKTVDP